MKIAVKPTRGEAFGILNAQGQFWTHSTFESEVAARAHMTQWNRAFNPPLDLSRHTVVPVKVTVSLRKAKGSADV